MRPFQAYRQHVDPDKGTCTTGRSRIGRVVGGLQVCSFLLPCPPPNFLVPDSLFAQLSVFNER